MVTGESLGIISVLLHKITGENKYHDNQDVRSAVW